jgi:predicted Zn-dependent protease
MDEREKSEMRKVGDLPGTRPYSTEQEMHADRVALEFMARAGYPMEGLVEVWHRLVEADRGKLVLWRYHAPSQRRQGAVRDVLTQVRSEDRTGDAAPGS